ncbi:hypothetical protein B0H19DRAFT_1073594 [Mycena capillaripes]|nr:hypothetical protein B0H19DRAFT_1073594 [Mycena capillaripes]
MIGTYHMRWKHVGFACVVLSLHFEGPSADLIEVGRGWPRLAEPLGQPGQAPRPTQSSPSANLDQVGRGALKITAKCVSEAELRQEFAARYSIEWKVPHPMSLCARIWLVDDGPPYGLELESAPTPVNFGGIILHGWTSSSKCPEVGCGCGGSDSRPWVAPRGCSGAGSPYGVAMFGKNPESPTLLKDIGRSTVMDSMAYLLRQQFI